MNCLPRILLVSLILSTATLSFSYDKKTIACASAAAVAVGGISYAIYKNYLNRKLYKAIYNDNDLATVKNLLEKGADANAWNYIDYMGSKQPAFTIVASRGNIAIAQEFIAHGANVNAKITFGKGSPWGKLRGGQAGQLKDDHAIVIASRKGHIDMVKLLLAHGADIESTGHDDATPLIEAAYRGDTDIVTFLLKQGANINAQDERGKTALIYAVERHSALMYKGFFWADDEKPCDSYYENSQIIKALIEHGADVNIKDMFGRTALQYAQENGFTEIAELLKTHGAIE